MGISGMLQPSVTMA